MDVFNGYLTESERDDALFMLEHDVNMSKYNTMLEMVELHRQQSLREAEYKVFSEGGTYDDYLLMLEAIQQEAKTQQDGIFTQMLSAIGGLIDRILKGIASLFTGSNGSPKIDPNANYTVTEEYSNAHGILGAITSQIDGIVADINARRFGAAGGKISAILAGTAGVAGIVKLIAGKLVKGSEVSKDTKEAESILTKLKGAIQNLFKMKDDANAGNTDPEKEVDPKPAEGDTPVEGSNSPFKFCLDKLNELIAWIEKGFDTIKGVVSSAVNAALNKVDGKEQPENGSEQKQGDQTGQKPDNAQPTDKNQPAAGNAQPTNKAQPANGNAQPTNNNQNKPKEQTVTSSTDDTIDVTTSIFGNIFESTSGEELREVAHEWDAVFGF